MGKLQYIVTSGTFMWEAIYDIIEIEYYYIYIKVPDKNWRKTVNLLISQIKSARIEGKGFCLVCNLSFTFFFLFPNWTHLPFETSPGTGDKSLACLSLSLPHSGTIRLNYYLLLLITYYWTIIICTHLKPVCTLRYRSTYVWCSLIILPFQFKEAYRRSNMFFRVNVCA